MDSLCWECIKAYGECSWAKEFKPVKGWNAEPTKVKSKESNYNSYHVISCPEYQPDKRFIKQEVKKC
jgi:hypothetical protein